MTRLIGKSLDPSTIKIILVSLGIAILSETEGGMEVEIPPYKVDVSREADVVEEIIRIYGYNNIDFSPEIRTPLSIARKPDPDRIQNLVSEFLCSNGYTEIMNNSLTKSAYYESNLLYPASESVRMLNPLSRDLDIMRQTLLYGGMESIVYNVNRKMADLKLYEFGKIYHGKYREERRLGIFMTGRYVAENWNNAEGDVDVFGLKAVVMGILSRIGIPVSSLVTVPVSDDQLVSGISLLNSGEEIAVLGSVAKSVLKQFDCRQQVFFADLNWEKLLAMVPVSDLRFRELPRYPEVRRDLALLINRDVSYAEIEKAAFAAERKLLKRVSLFDVYEGEKIDAGKRSYALSFILQDDQKTLTEKEIEKVMTNLIRHFGEKFQAVIR